MDDEKLLEHSKKTKQQAKVLLQSTKLLEILEKYGDVHLVGSYPLDIMYGPDIDIIVETKNIRKNSIAALQEIIEKELFRKIEYGDFVKFSVENRPKGYILVLKAMLERVKWEIEVWFLEDSNKQREYNNFLK